MSPSSKSSSKPVAISAPWAAVSPAPPIAACRDSSAGIAAAVRNVRPLATAGATNRPARPKDKASKTPIGMPRTNPRFLALAMNSGSAINSNIAASSFISTPESLISSFITAANSLAPELAPIIPIPTAGLRVIPAASIAATDDGKDSPTTLRTAPGFLAVAIIVS